MQSKAGNVSTVKKAEFAQTFYGTGDINGFHVHPIATQIWIIIFKLIGGEHVGRSARYRVVFANKLLLLI